MQIHTIQPIYNRDSKILILGTFPSIKSREESFFYAHPQNRFWKVLALVFEQSLPNSIEEKTEFLLKNKIALWDVISSCDIVGSSDSSIKNVKVNDIGKILKIADIQKIFVNGNKAYQLYRKYIEPEFNISAVCLPSTSPANARYNLEKLLKDWQKIKIGKL